MNKSACCSSAWRSGKASETKHLTYFMHCSHHSLQCKILKLGAFSKSNKCVRQSKLQPLRIQSVDVPSWGKIRWWIFSLMEFDQTTQHLPQHLGGDEEAGGPLCVTGRKAKQRQKETVHFAQRSTDFQSIYNMTNHLTVCQCVQCHSCWWVSTGQTQPWGGTKLALLTAVLLFSKKKFAGCSADHLTQTQLYTVGINATKESIDCAATTPDCTEMCIMKRTNTACIFTAVCYSVVSCVATVVASLIDRLNWQVNRFQLKPTTKPSSR